MSSKTILAVLALLFAVGTFMFTFPHLLTIAVILLAVAVLI